MITTDGADPEPLAVWWAEQTGAAVDQSYDGAFVTVKGGGLPLELAFQKVPDPTAGKNRVHLDLMAADLDADVDRLLSAGATLVGRRGNEFCLAQQGAEG